LLHKCFSQSANYWQQHVDYKMNVVMDVKTYQYKTQELVYTNNSQDTLSRVLSFVQQCFSTRKRNGHALQNVKIQNGRMVNKIKVTIKTTKTESQFQNTT
jgi:hypothetical protein